MDEEKGQEKIEENEDVMDKKDQEKNNKKDKLIHVKESEIESLKNELEDYKDRYLRIYAEFENARKRMDRDRQEFIKYASANLMVEFLNVLDNLERSVNAARTKHQDYDAFIKGIEMVMSQVYEMLKKNGLEAIEAKGKPFDPHCHEILMQEETENFEDGIVMDEFQRGYKLGDRVVRTTKIKIAKKKETAVEPKETEEQ